MSQHELRLSEIDTPALLLDSGKMQQNIERMRLRADALGVALRPHLKTTKSVEVARRLVAEGGGITVSTLREAEYFAAAGYRDIFYAVSISPQKLPRVAALLKQGANVLLGVDSIAAAGFVAEGGKAHGVEFQVLLEVDSGEGRSGVLPGHPDIAEIAAALQGEGARLAGVFTHGGHSYGGRSAQAHADTAEQERLAVTSVADALRKAGHACDIVSIGSTPTVRHARDLTGVTEVRAGVYVLGDLFQAAIDGCGYDDIAISVLATVIGNQPERDQIVVDAGSLALSKDISTSKLGPDGDLGLGLVMDADTGRVIEDLFVQTAYQEHGVIKSRSGRLDHTQFPIGRRLRILPNHACLTAAAYDCYHVLGDDGRISGVWGRINGW